jgi:hypothetical protein
MTTSKFKVKLLETYLIELFGNQKVTEPLLRKNLSQKVKFQLKKLGILMEEEHKLASTQLRELFDKYSKEEKGEPNMPPKRVLKDEFKEQFETEAREIEEMDVEISHYDFSERDFIDQSTGEIVAGNIYYNVLDIIFFEKEVATAS